jgi:hypothetical protein
VNRGSRTTGSGSQALIFTDGLQSVLRHVPGKSFVPGFPDLCNAGGPVRFEQDRKDFGEKVIELFAVHGVAELPAFGATGIAVFHVAGTDLAPGGFAVFMAPGAGTRQVLFTGSAIQSAIGDQLLISYYLFHILFFSKKGY